MCVDQDPEDEGDDSDQDEPAPREPQDMDASESEATAKMFANIFGKDRRPADVKFAHCPKVTMSGEHLPNSMKLHVSHSTRAKPVVYRPTQIDPVYYQAFNSAVASDFDHSAGVCAGAVAVCACVRACMHACVHMCVPVWLCACVFRITYKRLWVCVRVWQYQVLKSSNIGLSSKEALVIATSGTPEAVVAGLLLGFKKAPTATHQLRSELLI